MERRSGRFEPGQHATLADKFLRANPDGSLTCKTCWKDFAGTSNPQRSARRHVLTVHQPQENPIEMEQQDGENIDQPYVNNFDDMEIEDVLDNTERYSHLGESFPAVLFGLIYIRFGFSEREGEAVLRLLKLRLDFSAVGTVRDVLKDVGVAETTERAACRDCELEGTVQDNQFGCTRQNCTGAGSNVQKYITTDLASQIRTVCEGETLFQFRPDQFRFHKKIQDVTDGRGYRKTQLSVRRQYQIDPGDVVITLIASTDGVQIFESSTQSLWPFSLTICELPPTVRFRQDKIVTFSLWQGSGKPPLECITNNLQMSVDAINGSGLFIETASGRKRAFVCVPAITGDLQARSYFTNMVAIAGEYSCPTCEIRGKVVPKGAGHCRQFVGEGTAPRRTDLSIRRNAEEGTPESPSLGFYGIPRINALRCFDYGEGILIDAMHGCCIGVAKKYTSLLFEGPERYLTKDERSTARSRYRMFLPPPTFSRNPVDISVTQWKASDFRNWIIHYSLTCLSGLLEPKYFRHWSLFVDAYTVLNSADIREDDLARAGGQLQNFCRLFPELFDENEFGMNFHGLTHLAEMVDLWGPLFCYDLFAFESQNGWLTRHSHATHNVTRSLMKPLLGAQVLRRRSEAINLPGEIALLKLIQGKRIRDGTSGENWMTWSALRSVNFAETGLPMPHPCEQHSLRRTNTASVGSIAVWTDRYRRPKRTVARVFLMTDKRNSQHTFIFAKDLIHCDICRRLYLVARRMIPEFLEPNRIQLVEDDAPNVVIDAKFVELQECVLCELNGTLEITLVSKSRYSD